VGSTRGSGELQDGVARRWGGALARNAFWRIFTTLLFSPLNADALSSSVFHVTFGGKAEVWGAIAPCLNLDPRLPSLFDFRLKTLLSTQIILTMIMYSNQRSTFNHAPDGLHIGPTPSFLAVLSVLD